MKIAIMQPTYLPWLGYFNLIKTSDKFVFFDDVQFAKRSWQQRNRILLNGKEKMLTIPVLSKGKFNQCINEALTDDSLNWKKSHLLIIKSAYSKHPHGKNMIDLMEFCYNNTSNNLSDINTTIIIQLAKKIGLQTEFLFSSSLQASGKKSDYLLQICKELNASTYLSALGSKEYIEQEGLFASSNIEVIYQHFELKEYRQIKAQEFCPYMSIIDLIANVGFENVLEYI